MALSQSTVDKVQKGKLVLSLMRMDLVILDELRYFPLPRTAVSFMSRLYERTSVIITLPYC